MDASGAAQEKVKNLPPDLEGRVAWLCFRLAVVEERLERGLDTIEEKLEEAKDEFGSTTNKQTDSYVKSAKRIGDGLDNNVKAIEALAAEMKNGFEGMKQHLSRRDAEVYTRLEALEKRLGSSPPRAPRRKK